jgi:hypothetical protein
MILQIVNMAYAKLQKTAQVFRNSIHIRWHGIVTTRYEKQRSQNSPYSKARLNFTSGCC